MTLAPDTFKDNLETKERTQVFYIFFVNRE